MKKQNLRKMGRNLSWQTLVGVVFGLTGVAYVSWGATYNLYFNNTEQGNNSTATPNLTVTDGKVSSSGAGTTNAAPAAVTTNTTGPAVAEPVHTEPVAAPSERADATSIAEAEPERPKKRTKWFKLTAGAGAAIQKYDPHNLNGMGSDFRSTQPALVIEGSMNLVKDLGINIFAASNVSSSHESSSGFFGAELELMPLHLSIGRFENVLDLGLLAGVNNIRNLTESDTLATFPSSQYSGSSSSSYGSSGDTTVSRTHSVLEGHLGARANVNLGNDWAITTAVRGGKDFAMAEAGLSWRF